MNKLHYTIKYTRLALGMCDVYGQTEPTILGAAILNPKNFV